MDSYIQHESIGEEHGDRSDREQISLLEESRKIIDTICGQFPRIEFVEYREAVLAHEDLLRERIDSGIESSDELEEAIEKSRENLDEKTRKISELHGDDLIVLGNFAKYFDRVHPENKRNVLTNNSDTIH